MSTNSSADSSGLSADSATALKAGWEGRFRAADASGIAVPGRALLLQFLAECAKPMSGGEICARFGIKLAAAEKALVGRLERMRAYGLVEEDGRGGYAVGRGVELVRGRVSGRSGGGGGFVVAEEGGEDLVLHRGQMRKLLHGDRVLARRGKKGRGGRTEGVVIEVLDGGEGREVIGQFHRESGVCFVTPQDSRFARDIRIAKGAEGGAGAGDVVVVRITQHPMEAAGYAEAVGTVTEVLGGAEEAGLLVEVAIRKYKLPCAWPAEVEAQLQAEGGRFAQEAVQVEDGRRDLRDLPLVTIDGEDAKDFDDAVYCARRDDGWRLVVGIADVSHYVAAGSALDEEALKRGNSVYFPNRVLSMLPTQLANGICSLNPKEDRYAMVCDMEVDARGEVGGYDFYPAVIRSHARMTYTVVNEIVARRDAGAREEYRELAPHLDDLYALYRVLAGRRRERGSIDFEFPEAFIEFDAQQKVSGIRLRQRNDAHRLIEECMLAANVCAARFLQERLGARTIYRLHDAPEEDAVVELRRFLGGLGLQLGGGMKPQAGDYAKLMEGAIGAGPGSGAGSGSGAGAKLARANIAPLVQILLLRSLQQAEYRCEEGGHFALGYGIYTHFTSPIRRYSDLMVHRQIRRLIGEKGKGAVAGMPELEALQEIAAQCSLTERRADDASREVVAGLKAEFMQDKIGEEFEGVISSVKEFGLFVQLDEFMVDGLVHIRSLGRDYYRFEPLRFQLVGERSGRRYCLGGRVRVRVARVNVAEGKIDFALERYFGEGE